MLQWVALNALFFALNDSTEAPMLLLNRLICFDVQVNVGRYSVK
jgi:hypothetical protein